jgi:hypothetical protein
MKLLILKYLTAVTAFCLFQIYVYRRFMPDQAEVFVGVNFCLMILTYLYTRPIEAEDVR